MYKLGILTADQVKLELYKQGYMQGPVNVERISDSDLKQLNTRTFNIKINN
jgi:hypothetical protein